MRRLRFGLALAALCALMLTGLPASARGVRDKAELMQVLEENGIRPGSVVWLSAPSGELPGLSRIIVKDGDLQKDTTYRYTNPWRVVLVGESDGKDVAIDIGESDFFPGLTSLPNMFYLNGPPKWSKKVLKAVANREVLIGMTSRQAMASWGEPYHINRSGGSWGVHEQWVYHFTFSDAYLYFQNGKLTSWQN